jgi:hypothetical protein
MRLIYLRYGASCLLATFNEFIFMSDILGGRNRLFSTVWAGHHRRTARGLEPRAADLDTGAMGVVLRIRPEDPG